MVAYSEQTESIYDGAHPISHNLQRSFGPQRHIVFTTSPEGIEEEFQNAAHEIRTYSGKNFKRVKELLGKMYQAELTRRDLHKIGRVLENVEEYVIEKEQACYADGDCSEGHHTWCFPSKQALTSMVDKAAPYFTGLSRVDLYAALSGTSSDTGFAGKAVKRKVDSLVAKLKENQQKIDKIFIEIMQVPQLEKEKRDKSRDLSLTPAQ